LFGAEGVNYFSTAQCNTKDLNATEPGKLGL